MKGYISLDNSIQHIGLSVSVKDPFIKETIKKLKREHKDISDELLMIPQMLEGIHELISYIASKNDDTFDNILKLIKETEEMFPAVGNMKDTEVRTIYEITH